MRSHDIDRRTLPLRIIRVDRPRLVKKANDRGRTFGAGLEQAEQLWRASDAVGLVASPILVFYGFTQAGRAICAAGVKDNGWRPKEGHGLQFGFDLRPQGEVLDLSSAWIEPHGQGLIQLVASVFGSPVLARRTNRAELISSLDWEIYFDFEKWGYLRPLDVGPAVVEFDAESTGLRLSPVPPALVRKEVVTTAGGGANERFQTPTIDEITEWLASYPSLAVLGAPAKIGTIQELVLGPNEFVPAINLEWRIPPSDASRSPLNAIDVTHGDRRHGVAFPGVGGNNEAMHEIVLWWLILYGFSMLARYYPDAWTRVLDTDKSELAVPIDDLFSLARAELAPMVFRVLNAIKET